MIKTISFILLILGIVFITIGISHQLSPTYTTKKNRIYSKCL